MLLVDRSITQEPKQVPNRDQKKNLRAETKYDANNSSRGCSIDWRAQWRVHSQNPNQENLCRRVRRMDTDRARIDPNQKREM